MAGDVQGQSVYMQPGQSINISAPVSTKNHNGWFAASKPPEDFFKELPNSTYSKTEALVNGFSAENEDVGVISASSDIDGAAIEYKHNVGQDNAIWFFSRFDEMTVIKVIHVPIHDHSSIVQGGPAYGTYFDDDEEAT